MWKLNAAYFAGLVYSTLALGVIQPLLNITVTKNRQKNKTSDTQFNFDTSLEQFLNAETDISLTHYVQE